MSLPLDCEALRAGPVDVFPTAVFSAPNTVAITLEALDE